VYSLVQTVVILSLLGPRFRHRAQGKPKHYVILTHKVWISKQTCTKFNVLFTFRRNVSWDALFLCF